MSDIKRDNASAQSDDDPRPSRAPDADDANLFEARVSGERVFRGALLDVRRDRARMPDGGESVREYIVHPGAVLVVPIQDDGRFVLERQFRYPHNRTFIEFPAGKLDPGESALETGLRELVEEAGYSAMHWTRLGVVHPVISYSTETIEIYAARRLAHVGAKLDPGEFLELLSWTAGELDSAIDEGRVSDAKTVAARLMHERWTTAAQRSITVRITGRVQGVGYRDWLMRRAQAAGVAGWVRNRRDGSVEAFMQGTRGACDRISDECVDGPRSAEVLRVEVARSPYDPMQNGRFEQRPSA
jgi:ADP-ribose pyrophosphatase